MPRPIAFSAKQKREQLQDKRAVQRGELEPSQVRYARNPAGNYRPGANHLPNPASANTATTRLISKFASLTPEYVERSRYVAHTLPLIRPISDEAAVFKLDWMERDGGRLSCPVRPGFEMGQAKEEVERREQETYGLWLKETTAIVEEWVERGEKEGQDEGAEVSLLSPTWFETNLEVWRQLCVLSPISALIYGIGSISDGAYQNHPISSSSSPMPVVLSFICQLPSAAMCKAFNLGKKS